MRPKREKPREARVHQFRPLKGAVMAAYRSTLADLSLFDKSRFFGRQEEARAFDRGFAAEFPGALRTEDFAFALAEGASADGQGLAFVADECGRCPFTRPAVGCRARPSRRRTRPAPFTCATFGASTGARRRTFAPPIRAVRRHDADGGERGLMSSRATAPPRSLGSSRPGTKFRQPPPGPSR